MKRLLTVFLLLLSASFGRASNDINCRAFTVEERSQTRAFWTPDVERAARPIEMPELSVEEFTSMFRLSLFDRFHFSSHFATPLLAVGAVSGVGQAQPATVSNAPFNAAGRLFFTNRFGATDWCTAAFTGDPSILLTAAHCVQSRGGTFYKGVYFSRAYEDGPGEQFDISFVATFNSWVNDPEPTNFEHDYAFLQTSAPVQGVTPLTLASGSSSNWFALGYPATINGGKTMIFLEGTRGAPAKMIVMENNPLDHGLSGGSWILPDPTGAIGQSVLTIASVLAPAPNTMLGPFLTKEATTLFEFVRNGCK